MWSKRSHYLVDYLEREKAVHILIVEDDATQRLILCNIVRSVGYTVLEANDGEAAWQILQTEPIQLVITDWMMPGLQGPDLIHRIRQARLPRYIYVLLFTARAAQTDVLEGLRAGADDYLTKPFDPEELLARLAVGSRIVRLETSLRAAYDQLYLKATHDELTSLLNRRTLYEQVSAAYTSEESSEQSLGVLLLDIDHFKAINDQYGHPVGDLALQHFASLLNTQRRDTDLAARWGGEEFVLVLRDVAPADAEQVAERIRATVAAMPLVLPDGQLLVMTVSIGVTVMLPGESLSFDALLHRADQALYAAKHGGRNQVYSTSLAKLVPLPSAVRHSRQPAAILSEPLMCEPAVMTLPFAEGVGVEPTDDLSLDRAILTTLVDLFEDDDPAIFDSVISTFLADSMRVVGILREALVQGDTQQFIRAAHTLKGSSGTLGAYQLAALCEEAETLGRTDALDEASRLLPRIKDEYTQVAMALEQIRLEWATPDLA